MYFIDGGKNMEDMKKVISDFITDNWGTSEGEYVHRWRCNTFDDDYEGIKAIYNYVKSL